MPVAWHIVPFFGQTEEDYTELLQTVQGADCTLADLRLIRTHRSGPASVIFAHRQLGEGYGGAESVQFDVYRLKENQERESGRPLYYFELEHTIRPKPPYCDVNEAFATELGLGNAGH
jgi:predicted SnoaL-like aldol condensation-catalyzing enzyme